MGWGAIVKTIGAWYPPERNGTIMGVISLNFQFGGVLGTLFAGYLVARGSSWVSNTVRSALGQLNSGVEHAQSQFAALPHATPHAIESTASGVVLALSPDPEQQDYDVVLLSATPGFPSYQPRNGPHVVPSSIPSGLRRLQPC